jgi:hypothetical protein
MAMSLLLACSEPNTADDAADPCGPEDDVGHAARTGASGVKTGATTAWEGVKTAGKTVGGLFDEGTDGAKRQWNEGKEKTSETASEGADDTRAVAKDKPCP